MIQIIVIVEQKMQQQINTSAAGKTSQCIERKLNNLRFVLYLYAQLYIYKSVYINVCMYLLIELYSLLYLFGTFHFFTLSIVVVGCMYFNIHTYEFV